MVCRFFTSKLPKIDLTLNMNDRKFIKFPHCDRLTKHFEVNNTSGFDFEKCVTENQKLCHFPPVISQSCFLAGLRPFCRISTDSDHQEYSKR